MVCASSFSDKPSQTRDSPKGLQSCCQILRNDMLLTGPDLPQNLVGSIFMFWEDPIALKADIEAMFLQVNVPQQNCKVLRFLWWNHPEDRYLCISIPGTFLEQRVAQLVLTLLCREMRRTTKRTILWQRKSSKGTITWTTSQNQ